MIKKIIKAVIPSSWTEAIQRFKYSKAYRNYVARVEKMKLPVYWLMSRNRVLASIFYLVFSREFGRESKSVLAGRLQYYNRVHSKNSKGNIFQLKRNIHRIEKGLIMRPRRDVFALEYIHGTVDNFRRLYQINQKHEIVQWARDVLFRYFEVIKKTDDLKKLEQEYLAIITPSDESSRSPFARNSRPDSGITYEQMYTMARRRRSVRWYEPKAVPNELIDKAMAVANEAPSACNRQPFRYEVFTEYDLVQKIINIPMGTPGFGKNIHNVAVVIGDYSAYYSERDRHVIYIDASLSAMSFVFALETLGLSSVCINWPDVEKLERMMDKALNLAPYERPVMLIAFGYEDNVGMVPYSQKKPLSNLRKINNHEY